MQTEFKFLLDKIDSGGAPLFLNTEINRLLSIAQDKFVSKRMYGNNIRRSGFEEDQKRRDDLRTLIHSVTFDTSSFISSDFTKPTGKLVKLPEDYRHAINEEVVLNNNTRVSVTPLTHDRYNKIVDDPFNNLSSGKVYRLGFGSITNTIEDDPDTDLVETGSTTSYNYFEILSNSGISGSSLGVNKYYLRYIKNLSDITDDSSCILPNHTHREIVRMAVLEALESIESPRYQSSKIELNEIE